MKRFLSLVLCALLLASLSLVGANAQVTELPHFDETQHVVIYTNNATLADPSHELNAFEQWLLDTCNIALDYRLTGWDERITLLLADAAASDLPDVVTYLSPDEYTRLITRGVLQPLDPYLDVTDEVFLPTATEYYAWMGDHYCVSNFRWIGAYTLCYNKALFENNGVKTPAEYYAEGNWNWDTFLECAKALTMDTNGDGTIDQWGYYGWSYTEWIAANGGNIIDFDRENGKISLAMDKPATVNGLQFAVDLYKEGGVSSAAAVASGWETNFANGLIAMIGGQSTYIRTFKNSMDPDTVDFVPFPLGPDNTDGTVPAVMSANGIGKGCKNPELAAAYIYAEAYYYANVLTQEGYYMSSYKVNEDEAKLLAKIEGADAKLYPNIDFAGVGGMIDHKWDLCGAVAWSPSSASAAISQYIAMYEAEVAAEMTLIDEWKALNGK